MLANRRKKAASHPLRRLPASLLLRVERALPFGRAVMNREARDDHVEVAESRRKRLVEVVAVELDTGELFVIHSMPMRQRYRAQYREAQRWPD